MRRPCLRLAVAACVRESRRESDSCRTSDLHATASATRSATQSGLLDLRRNDDYLGPTRHTHAAHTREVNGTVRASEASCADWCQLQRRSCAGYAWREAIELTTAECFLIARRSTEGAACQPPSAVAPHRGSEVCLKCPSIERDREGRTAAWRARPPPARVITTTMTSPRVRLEFLLVSA